MAVASDGRQPPPMDGTFQVTHTAALAVRTASWLWEQEAHLAICQLRLDGEVTPGRRGI